MTREQINLLSMLKSVVQFFTENPTLLTGKTALQDSLNKLKAYIHEIELLEQEQAKNAKADTALKGETKVALIDAILKVVAGVAAHAAATNNTSLKMAADVTKNDLKKLRDNNLIVEARTYYELALPLAANIAIWEVTQADIDTLDTNSTAFDAKDPAIKNIKARSTQATADIKLKLDKAYNFTKDTIDPMMLPIKLSNPTLYGHYQKARTIINTAGGHGKAVVPDAVK